MFFIPPLASFNEALPFFCPYSNVMKCCIFI